MSGLTEHQVRLNEPVKLFEIDGKTYSVRLLPINQVDVWLDRVRIVAEAEDAIKAAISSSDPNAIWIARKAFAQALYDCVLSYDPQALPRSELEASITPAQMVDAFMLLRELSDPFEVCQRAFVNKIEPIAEAIAQIAKMQKVAGQTPIILKSAQ